MTMVERIGSDESLKGDTFGGIVVAAVKANDEERELLEGIGVKDSKKITDIKIVILARKIREIARVYFVNMYPEQYNKEINKLGLVDVMNKLHIRCINALKTEGEEVVVDLFPGCKIPDAICETKAEDTYIEVAAASIIAREEALKQMRELSVDAGFKLPLGSSHVMEALIRLRDKKIDFTKFAKTSFRNVREIIHTQELQSL